jgi:hypothetical protein
MVFGTHKRKCSLINFTKESFIQKTTLYNYQHSTISYLGVIRGVQNFTPVLKIHTPWLHQDNKFISYEALLPFYCLRKKKKPKKTSTFSILHILHILLFIIVKFYVNVSFHIILLLCVVQNYFILFYPWCKWFSWGGVLFIPR